MTSTAAQPARMQRAGRVTAIVTGPDRSGWFVGNCAAELVRRDPRRRTIVRVLG